MGAACGHAWESSQAPKRRSDVGLEPDASDYSESEGSHFLATSRGEAVSIPSETSWVSSSSSSSAGCKRAGCLSILAAPSQRKAFHLVPPKGWDGFIRALRISARNNFPWQGERPVPEAPDDCAAPWLLPASDALSLRIATLEASLRKAGWKILTSKPHVIRRLGNKANLREYAAQVGLLSFLPEHFVSSEDASYPCVLKPAVGEYGKETSIAWNAEDVQQVVPSDGELGSRWVLQELITGCYELAASLLVQDGRILDSIGTKYEYSKEVYVWPDVDELGRGPFTVPEAHLATMAGFLAEYTGICNFNYKLRGDGRMCIFEINTRIGSDLACDVPRARAREFFLRLNDLSV